MADTEERNNIKAIAKTEDELRVANYLVLWGDERLRDLTGITGKKNADGTGGEFFTPTTDFESEHTKAGRLAVDWEHRFDPEVKDSILGYVDWSTAKTDERGLWVERVLTRRNRYVRMLEDLIEAGLIGSSSEATNPGVERGENGEIKRWPLFRDTLTVNPMEPRMMTENQVVALKSVAGSLPGIDALLTAEESAAVAVAGNAETVEGAHGEVGASTSAVETGGAEPEGSANVGEAKTTPVGIEFVNKNKGGEMSDETNTAAQNSGQEEKIDRLSREMENLGKALNDVLKVMQDEPTVRKAGAYSVDGGAADSQIKSFPDWLLAVQRGDTKRLQTVYNTSGKAMTEAVGADGGYAVPTEYNARLLEIGYTQSPILKLVQAIPVSSDAGEWPALDHYTAPTAGSGNTAMAAGVKATKVKEDGTLTSTQPTLEMLRWRLGDVGGYTQVTANLASDSPIAIEALLTRLFGVAVSSKKEYFILRGNGVGEPLGIMNSPAAVGVTPATDNAFAFVDAVNMIARHKRLTPSARFVLHQSVLPDFAGSGWTQGNNIMRLAELGFGDYIQSEHLALADASGCVLLADFGAYLLFEKGNIEIAYSEHVGFTSRLGTWRFFARMDGQPWVKNYVTLANPGSAYTVSPFVYFND